MNGFRTINSRRLSIAGFSFLFAYILSFQFEGQVLYSLLNMYGVNTDRYILAGIISHFIGLFTCGMIVRSQVTAKNMILGGMSLCLATTIPFFSFPCSMDGRADCKRIRQWNYCGGMGIFSKHIRSRMNVLSPAQMF